MSENTESILSIFEGDGGEDDLLSERAHAESGFSGCMKLHRASFPDNNRLLEAPEQHAESDAVRFNRLKKHLSENAGIHIRLNERCFYIDDDEIYVYGAAKSGNFNFLAVRFPGESARERLLAAASYQPLFHLAGLPLAVTLDGELHNHLLGRQLTSSQLAWAELGSEAIYDTYGYDITLDELCRWKDELPSWEWHTLANWHDQGFTPQEAKWWRNGELDAADFPPKEIWASGARSWKDAGQSKEMMDEWHGLGQFRFYEDAKDWIDGGVPRDEALEWVLTGFTYQSARVFMSAGIDSRQAPAVASLVSPRFRSHFPPHHIESSREAESRLVLDTLEDLLSSFSLPEIEKLIKNDYKSAMTAKLMKWFDKPGRLTREQILEWAFVCPYGMCASRYRSRWLKAGLAIEDMPKWRQRLGSEFSLDRVIDELDSGCKLA